MEFTLKNGKRILLWICSLICIFSSFSCEIHENSSELSESTIEKHIDKAFSFWQKPDSPGAAIVIIKNGKIFLKKGYGYANIEHDIPITTKTVFNIASLSKQFTAMAIALLAERGDLSLDDEIRKYLPEIPEAYGCFGSAKFGQMKAFLKLQIICNNLKLGEMHDNQEKVQNLT